MLKRLPVALFLAVLLVCMFSAPAFAADKGFGGILNQANATIQSLINKAVSDANVAKADLNRRIDYTNLLVKQRKISRCEADGRIMNYKADFKNQITALASRLIAETDRVVVAVTQEANRRGIKISVWYVEVNLGGYIFLVDPLRIVGN